MPTVLRQSQPVPGRRVPAEAFEATRRAAARLARAEEEAAAIVARAQEACDAIRARAEEAGLRQGLARAGAVLVEASRERDRVLAASGDEVVTLAIEVARKVIGRELSADPGVVVDLVRAALQAARARRQATLRVHPENVACLRDAADGPGASLGGVPGLSIEEDASLAPGDVVVETETGRLDARIETQLDALREALAGALR